MTALTPRQARMLREALACYESEGGPMGGWLTRLHGEEIVPTVAEWEEVERLLELIIDEELQERRKA